MSNKVIQFDTRLPALSVWDITTDTVCLDMGNQTYYDLSDMQALAGLRRARNRYKARLDYVDKEIARLEQLNAPTEHRADENRVVFAKVERYFREDYPRLLDIAIAEMEAKA